MNQYTTTIRAIDQHTGDLVTWNGPVVPGRNFDDAEMYCQANGLGYCKVDGIYTGQQIFIEHHQNN